MAPILPASRNARSNKYSIHISISAAYSMYSYIANSAEYTVVNKAIVSFENVTKNQL